MRYVLVTFNGGKSKLFVLFCFSLHLFLSQNDTKKEVIPIKGDAHNKSSTLKVMWIPN